MQTDVRRNRQKLSPREMEVMQFLCFGYTDRQIASELFISVHTAHVHVCAILRKLGVNSRAGAVGVFYRVGWEVIAQEPNRDAVAGKSSAQRR